MLALGMPCAICIVMTISDKRLRRQLLTAVVIKLLVLTVLWWMFIRDSRVSVDSNTIGDRFGVPTSTQGASK
ncbi:cytochrome oxidase putative small subunit CydP [Pseudomonas corrugata]|uniref:cytochrome oxidase putative small subunit CydP n=3 Tax=Pseudomonas corrugata TaxID=47879 RepID=UPI00067F2453